MAAGTRRAGVRIGFNSALRRCRINVSLTPPRERTLTRFQNQDASAPITSDLACARIGFASPAARRPIEGSGSHLNRTIPYRTEIQVYSVRKRAAATGLMSAGMARLR